MFYFIFVLHLHNYLYSLVMNANDQYHTRAAAVWRQCLDDDNVLISSNYVLVETTAILQHRFGMDALRIFDQKIRPLLEIIWIDEILHQQATSALLTANRRDLSFVDVSSFVAIRQTNLRDVFTFDRHFKQQGFICHPDE